MTILDFYKNGQLAVYSCIVLFFCSTFHCCYLPSHFGLMVLSCLMLIFQLYSIIIFGWKRPLKKPVQFLPFFYIFIFFIFIAFFQNLIEISEIWTDIGNLLVILNMVLWSLLYFKRKPLIKNGLKHINSLNKEYIPYNNILDFCNTLATRIGVEDMLVAVIEQVNNLGESNATIKKKYVMIAGKILADHNSYFRMSNDYSKDFNHSNEITQNLEQIITNSLFTDESKQEMINAIPSEISPTINNETLINLKLINEIKKEIIDSDQYKTFYKTIEKLCKMGLLEKIPDNESTSIKTNSLSKSGT